MESILDTPLFSSNEESIKPEKKFKINNKCSFCNKSKNNILMTGIDLTTGNDLCFCDYACAKLYYDNINHNIKIDEQKYRKDYLNHNLSKNAEKIYKKKGVKLFQQLPIVHSSNYKSILECKQVFVKTLDY